MTSKQTAEKPAVEGTVIPSQPTGDEANVEETFELEQSFLTKAKVFFGSNKKFFLGAVAGLVLGVAVKAGSDRLSSDTQDDEPLEPVLEA